MPLGIGGPKNFAIPRRDKRIPMEIGIHIAGHPTIPGTEATFTENVSARGVRVLTARRWNINDRLTVTMPSGSFRATARVAYCHSVAESRFAVGLELIDPTGTWVLGGFSD
ncbi:MAG TPA: PilZ domain-containing protein [Candidatus Aquilonibacter sp.]|nr:PilZ domain-containing protein [Candidatus Aquilonibacter sp.]